MIPEAVSLEQVDVWFQDEARIGQQNGITRMWARKGTRPRQLKQHEYESAYLFGAVCPSQDQAAALILPNVNSDAMKDHLDEISKQVPAGRHGVVVLDRASWHTTKKLSQFKNLSLLFLPPASPELNPQEQVWLQLRQQSLSNYAFKNYDDIVEKSCQAWMSFVSQPGAVKKLCQRPWINYLPP